MSVEIRNSKRQILAFDGYSYDEADGALILIASEFTNQRDIAPTLTNSRIEELLLYMQRFIEESVNGNIQNYCDDSDPAVNIANEFRKKIGKGMVSTEILRFFKVNEYIQGAGIGLSICKAIVNKCEGKIGVESEEGRADCAE